MAAEGEFAGESAQTKHVPQPAQGRAPSYINTPLTHKERSVIEALARRENRSRGQQLRHLAMLKLQEMGLLSAEDSDSGTGPRANAFAE